MSRRFQRERAPVSPMPRTTSAELVALGRAYRSEQLTLKQYRDLVGVALRRWNGTLRAGRFAEERASSAPRSQHV